jgi:hypothetical protein
LIAGYAAIYAAYDLAVPLPERLALISQRHKQYDTGDWIVLTTRHQPADTLMGHLTFALKYEGVDLGLLKKLFELLGAAEMEALIVVEPTGAYSRRLWFLYERLLQEKLNLPDLTTGNYVDVLDGTLQFPGRPVNSKRHRVRNNLPGFRGFCPLIRRTPALEKFLGFDLSGRIKDLVGRIHPDVMARTSALLLLKDSKASYAIEGERPPQTVRSDGVERSARLVRNRWTKLNL